MGPPRYYKILLSAVPTQQFWSANPRLLRYFQVLKSSICKASNLYISKVAIITINTLVFSFEGLLSGSGLLAFFRRPVFSAYCLLIFSEYLECDNSVCPTLLRSFARSPVAGS